MGIQAYTIKLIETYESEINQDIIKHTGHNKFDDLCEFDRGVVCGMQQLISKLKEHSNKG